MKPKYNGWRNRATWNCALWLDNDQGMYRFCRDFARAPENKGRITAAAARDFVLGSVFPDGQTPDGDNLDGSQGAIGWGEIARAIQEMR